MFAAEIEIKNIVPPIGYSGHFLLRHEKDSGKPDLVEWCVVSKLSDLYTGYFSGHVGIEICPKDWSDRRFDGYRIARWLHTQSENEMEWISLQDHVPAVGFRGIFELVNKRAAANPDKYPTRCVNCTVISMPGILGNFSDMMDIEFLPDDYLSPLLYNFKATRWTSDKYPEL